MKGKQKPIFFVIVSSRILVLFFLSALLLPSCFGKTTPFLRSRTTICIIVWPDQFQSRSITLPAVYAQERECPKKFYSYWSSGVYLPVYQGVHDDPNAILVLEDIGHQSL
ncbi:hypothetical protein DFP73DRAFT_556386, partial [Morchella snyderi]